MSITLAQAVPLLSAIGKRIGELVHERNGVSTIDVAKSASEAEIAASMPARNVDAITTELDTVKSDYRKLSFLVAQANLTATVKWDNQDLTLNEALELAKQMRLEANYRKGLGGRKKVERQRGYMVDTDTITVATYDPEAYRQAGLKMERQANLLSSLIEHQNHFVNVDFDASQYLG